MADVRTRELIEPSRLQDISNRMLGIDQGQLMMWRCDPIGPKEPNFITGGVYRVSGISDAGAAGTREWTLVLKIVKPDKLRDDASHYNYWRREALAYESGLLCELPANVRVPECYAMEEQDNGALWLWLEEMRMEPRAWGRTDYAYAAKKLGEFHAGYLLGEPLPDAAWVNRRWMRSWIRECRIYSDMPEFTSGIKTSSRMAALQEKLTRLDQDAEDWIAALEELPRTFSHQDYYEMNILLDDELIRKGELALIDWQFASISGIGEDLGRFFGLSVSRGQVRSEQIREYRELFFASYIEGLREAGWEGDERLPRFGFLASFALRSIWEVPKLLRKLLEEGESPQHLHRLFVCEEQMEAADEARKLLSELRMVE